MHWSPQIGAGQQIWPDGHGVEQLNGQNMLEVACRRPLNWGHRRSYDGIGTKTIIKVTIKFQKILHQNILFGTRNKRVFSTNIIDN